MNCNNTTVRRALVVEDDELTGWTVCRALADSGFEVRRANSVAEGKHEYKSGEYALVLSDYRLGDGTGIELAGMIRSMGGDCVIMMLTAEPSSIDTQDKESLRISHILRKPVDIAELRRLTKNIDVAVDAGTRKAGLYTVISMRGEVTVADVNAIRDVTGWVAMDASMVKGFSGEALDCIAELEQNLRAGGGRLCLVGLSEELSSVMLGFLDSNDIDTFETIEAAASSSRRLAGRTERQAVLGMNMIRSDRR